MSHPIFDTAEAALAHVRSTKIEGDCFELTIKDGMTLAAQPDPECAGMAIIVDQILAQGYEPAGYEQHNGHRVYLFKPMD